VRCPCDDPRVLEINHKNGGGDAEARELGRGNRLYADIVAGRRSIEDLEVLCRPHNHVHFLELRYPDLRGRFRVGWA